LRKFKTTIKRKLRQNTIYQIFFIIFIWFVCEQLSLTLSLPLSGGILGLFTILLLLQLNIVSIRSFTLGASWFLSEMILFFIPAIPSVMTHGELFGIAGLKVVAVILIGTVIVMLGTVFIVDITLKKFHKESR
jgi:holin-like protein